MENIIFKPSYEKLILAKKRRVERLEKLRNLHPTMDQIKDRKEAEIEIYEFTKIVQKRVNSENKYINAFMKMTDEEIKMVQDLLEN